MAEDKEKEGVDGDQDDASDAQTNQQDTAKVQIRRVVGVDPVTELAYTPYRTPEEAAKPHSSGMEHWQPGPDVDVFEVSADIASAAVKSGAFEVTETSRVKLKGGSSANP